MIQWHVAEESLKGTYKVVYIIGCIVKGDPLFCGRHMMSKYFKMLGFIEYWTKRECR